MGRFRSPRRRIDPIKFCKPSHATGVFAWRDPIRSQRDARSPVGIPHCRSGCIEVSSLAARRGKGTESCPATPLSPRTFRSRLSPRRSQRLLRLLQSMSSRRFRCLVRPLRLLRLRRSGRLTKCPAAIADGRSCAGSHLSSRRTGSLPFCAPSCPPVPHPEKTPPKSMRLPATPYTSSV